MLALLKLWQIGLGLLAGLLFGWFVMVPSAREAGRASGYAAGHAAGISEERIVHEEARRRAEAQATADRQTAQAAIDAVEREYHQRDQARALQVDALERALEQEQANVPVPSAADRVAGACRPAIPRGVRDALDAAGRAAPARSPSAKPDAALR